MSFNPETEIVETSHDALTRMHRYVIERNGQRWTVLIPDVEFGQFGPVLGASGAANKNRRRAFLARTMTAAMQGSSDAAPA